MTSKAAFLFALCAVSVAANALLAYKLSRPVPSRAAVHPAVSPPVATPAQTHLPSARIATPPDAAPLWSRLHSGDLKQLAANLRAAGFPAKDIRAIVNSLLWEKYAERLSAVQGFVKDTPYWKISNVYYTGDKRLKETRRLHREMDREGREILGEDFSYFNDESTVYQQQRYGNLSPEKLNKLRQIEQDYNELMEDYRMDGNLLPADKEKLGLLRKEQQADIAKLLTPEELLEYQMRNSTAASRLRGWNDSFDLTESEFRSLFPLYQKLDEQFPSQQTPDEQKAYRAAEDALQDQLRKILGEARFAEFKQSRAPNASQENRLVLRLGLPLTAATQLVQAKADFLSQSKTISGDKNLTPEERKARITALGQQSETKVRELLGDRGLELFRDYGGRWLPSK